jgi:hypothetical protein
MSSKYTVYPVYGKDEGRFVIGSSKDIPNIKQFRHNAKYGTVDCDSRNFIVIDWKRYKLKRYIDGIESVWRTFKSSEFWQHFRFTTPCEDWEIQAYGHIR